MECNGGAEKKKTYMSTITLEMKSSRESPAQGCGVTSTENGTALKGKKKTQRDTRKGQFETVFRPQTLDHSSEMVLEELI